MSRFAIALLLTAAFAASASAQSNCPNGQCPLPAASPTPAAAFPVLARINPLRAYIARPVEHSVVTHREVAHAGPFVKGQPMRNVLRGAARIVAAPFRLAKQVIQNGVERRQSRRAARRCSR